jgi:hypothetical protein
MTDTDNDEYASENPNLDAEWERRRLCVDGNCIGVIGPDGRCKECGLAGGEDLTTLEDAASDFSAFGIGESDDSQSETPPADEDEGTDADEWQNRRLCPDGNCIGVIGPDGRCKECGRPAEDR